MSEELKDILSKFDKVLENYELDKKLKQFSVDSIGHLFPNEMLTIKNTIDNQKEEIDSLNNIINETKRILGQYVHYSTPTEEQNAKNETIVDVAYEQLGGNGLKELKENK